MPSIPPVLTKAQNGKGGKNRAKNLTPEQLSAIGKLGARTRWKKKTGETARHAVNEELTISGREGRTLQSAKYVE